MRVPARVTSPCCMRSRAVTRRPSRQSSAIGRPRSSSVGGRNTPHRRCIWAGSPSWPGGRSGRSRRCGRAPTSSRPPGSGLAAGVAGVLAEVLYRLGIFEEAAAWSRRTERASLPEDFMAQAMWRSTRAKVLARRGEAEQAIRLSSEAVEQAPADRRSSHPRRLSVRSRRSVRLLDRADEARPMLEEALAVYVDKGIRLPRSSVRGALLAGRITVEAAEVRWPLRPDRLSGLEKEARRAAAEPDVRRRASKAEGRGVEPRRTLRRNKRNPLHLKAGSGVSGRSPS